MFVPSLGLCPLILVRRVFAAFLICTVLGQMMRQPAPQIRRRMQTSNRISSALYSVKWLSTFEYCILSRLACPLWTDCFPNFTPCEERWWWKRFQTEERASRQTSECISNVCAIISFVSSHLGTQCYRSFLQTRNDDAAASSTDQKENTTKQSNLVSVVFCEVIEYIWVLYALSIGVSILNRLFSKFYTMWGKVVLEKFPNRRKGVSAGIKIYSMFVPSLVLCPLILVRSAFTAFFILGTMMRQPAPQIRRRMQTSNRISSALYSVKWLNTCEYCSSLWTGCFPNFTPCEEGWWWKRFQAEERASRQTLECIQCLCHH